MFKIVTFNPFPDLYKSYNRSLHHPYRKCGFEESELCHAACEKLTTLNNGVKAIFKFVVIVRKKRFN